MMRSERLTLTFLPKVSPLGDVTYWFSFPSGHTLSIETGISWLLALESTLCSLTNGRMVPIGQAQNGSSSANGQEIPVSMDNVCPEGTEE